ncbi:MAG TPA: TraR/DksA C4-type zinc finger protein [Bacilli bacterium]|nr:TraR/DksA C4-type zinc finger protein [Bacilli bacterium]
MHLTTEQTKQLRSQMEEELSVIHDRLGHTDSYGMKESLFESMGELSHYDNHPADLGTEMFERGKDLALRDADSLRLNALDEALERMEEGTYGHCEHCGQPIAFARLEANPAAKFCVHCQEGAEEHEITANRPVEENFLYPSFGRTFLDNHDQTGFDGEDSWQAVARYGTSNGNDDNPWALDPNHMYLDADEPLGYVEDLEGFTIVDMDGRPVEDAANFVRNEPYERVFDRTIDEL